MQLRQAESVGMLDHHHRRVRHVHADFDDRGRNENLNFAVAETLHHAVFFFAAHAPVQQPHVQFWKNFFDSRSYSAVAAFNSCFDSSITGYMM